ncbi:hypothetical protein BP6252_05843 [Coleophoma cylindrospora]|uniref:holo-[acyl-carrier-protein] synthase n=1 Tax=Coleophoma cylindrospora TaxID=1849047 RepID=A0A3D8RV19_9HELO|nr:hypothetical protein BP6252_05843 [Coleophoma cylindrospora]
MDGKTEPRIIQWLLDTRPLWPVSRKASPKDEVQELKSVASRALSLLSPAEQKAVLQFYHVRDAKMSLASHLLKHLVITKYCNVSWQDSKISRDENKKPCFVPAPDCPEQKHIEFNVSHQAGIVSLIASIGFEGKVEVGTDVVCANERLAHDYKFIEKDGFFEWVDMHGDVFAEHELNEMKLYPVLLPEDVLIDSLRGYAKDQISRCQWRNQQINIPASNIPNGIQGKPVPIDTNVIIDAKLRRFYAFWCLREAYVKMTGEALLAPWLRDLEFRDVQPPAPCAEPEDSGSLAVGETLAELNIFFKGRPVKDVEMDLVAIGSHYMISAVIRAAQTADKERAVLGLWEHLELDRDVLSLAEGSQ